MRVVLSLERLRLMIFSKCTEGCRRQSEVVVSVRRRDCPMPEAVPDQSPGGDEVVGCRRLSVTLLGI